ncbi:MAG: hypothetical protein ACYSWZ_05390 [Planctomycetota bacterium]|jgi:hypothetical protein
MNKKSILLIILCALILSPFIFAIGDGKGITSYRQAIQNSTIKAKQSNEPNYVMRPKESLTVKEFMTLAAQHRIRRIEVYYIPWSSQGYGNHVYSEEALRNKEFYSKSIINTFLTEDLSTIKLELKEFTLDPDPVYLRFPDYRLGFVAQDNSGRELTISFVYDAPVMSINGTQYRTDHKLVASVINFLPHKSYQRINKELVYFWYFHGKGLYTQKNEQDKKDR